MTRLTTARRFARYAVASLASEGLAMTADKPAPAPERARRRPGGSPSRPSGWVRRAGRC